MCKTTVSVTINYQKYHFSYKKYTIAYQKSNVFLLHQSGLMIEK